MHLKNFPFSDQLHCCSTSPRRKVVSRFGLGTVISLILLIVVFYHVSFKAPFLASVWQRFNRFGVRDSTSMSILSLSFPATSCFSSSCSNASSVNDTTLDKLENSAVRNESNKGKVSKISGNRKFMDSGRKGVVLENAHVGNSSEKVKNGNTSLEGGRDSGKSVGFSGSEINKNATLLNANGQEKVSDEPKKENLSKNVRNENITAEGLLLGSKVSDDNSQLVETSNSFYGDCDIFHGRWVRDDKKPYYPPGSCPYIDRDFDCHLNKRPDNDYMKWKWQPHGCDVPSLNGTEFLERLRGQKLVFVGDSLNRNMWESLVCILRHSVADKEKVYEISGQTDFKKRGFYAFRFEDYNCSVDFVNSPFLVRESLFNSVNGSFETLRLDMMDETTSMYRDADILIFNTAHWWTHEKTSRGEDYYQEGNHVHRRLKVLEAYKRALSTWARWVDKHINHGRTRVIFRGYSAVHFSGGQWNTGGQCHKETKPIYNESHLEKYPRKMKALEYVLQDMRTPVIYLNISRLTEFRKDGHPSIYRKEYKTIEEQIAGEQAQDCSHWCLPGVPDTWNELLYASLLKTAGRG